MKQDAKFATGNAHMYVAIPTESANARQPRDALSDGRGVVSAERHDTMGSLVVSPKQARQENQ